MPDPASLDALHEIPDPIAPGAPAPVPAAVVPAEPAPTRAERQRRARLAIAISALWLVAAVGVFGPRADVGTPGVVLPMAAWLACGAIALGSILRPRARGLPAGVRTVQHAVWIVPAAYAVGALIVAAPEGGPLTWASVRSCLALSAAMTLGPLIAGAAILRGSFLSAPGWRGAAVGALAGFAGSVGIHAHCPCQSIGHLLAAHGAAIVLGAAAGAGLGAIGGRP